MVQVIPRGYSQHHAFCFCLPKEPIASQASLVLQSYSSQGKSWSCSGSPLALRKKNEEKHHCHQQSCCAQPKSMESSSSGNLWGLYIALISFNLIHCLSSGEAILFLHYVQQGCVCRKHWRPTSCTTSPNKKNLYEILEREILNKYSDKTLFPKAVKNTHFQMPLWVSGALQVVRVKLRLFCVIFEAAGMVHSQD